MPCLTTVWRKAVPSWRRWSALSILERRCMSKDAAPLNAWNFPCPVCGQMKAGHVLTCSATCESTLATDHADTHARLLTLKDDLECARSPDVRALFHQLETQALPSSTTSWADMLADAGVSSHLAHDPAVTRLISAAYSYPMTLRHYLPALLPSISSSIDAAHRVYILGARAEATMPRHLWTPLHPWRLDISLIGNHVPVMRSTPPSPPSSSLNLSFHNGLYHDLDLPSPHAFVLFNPGLGHPALRSQWRPTLARVLESHRPILLTSFSDEDLQRDVRVLETAGRRIDIAENPFGSTKASIDPMHVVAAPVHSNRFVCVVH